MGKNSAKPIETIPASLAARRPRLIHLSLNWPHSPSQKASGSFQPFCHSTLSEPANTQTDRWSGDRSVPRTLAILTDSEALIIYR